MYSKMNSGFPTVLNGGVPKLLCFGPLLFFRSKRLAIIIPLCLSLLGISDIESQSAKNRKAELLYNAILKNGWLEEKQELGVRLGELCSESEPYILKLFKAESY